MPSLKFRITSSIGKFWVFRKSIWKSSIYFFLLNGHFSNFKNCYFARIVRWLEVIHNVIDHWQWQARKNHSLSLVFSNIFPLGADFGCWVNEKIKTCRFHSGSSSEKVSAVCHISTKLCLSELCPIWAKLKIINSQFYYNVHWWSSSLSIRYVN